MSSLTAGFSRANCSTIHMIGDTIKDYAPIGFSGAMSILQTPAIKYGTAIALIAGFGMAALAERTTRSGGKPQETITSVQSTINQMQKSFRIATGATLCAGIALYGAHQYALSKNSPKAEKIKSVAQFLCNSAMSNSPRCCLLHYAASSITNPNIAASVNQIPTERRYNPISVGKTTLTSVIKNIASSFTTAALGGAMIACFQKAMTDAAVSIAARSTALHS
jgi:hypothetical protein